MINYKKTTYIILALVLMFAIKFMLIVHIFNTTSETGVIKENINNKIYFGC